MLKKKTEKKTMLKKFGNNELVSARPRVTIVVKTRFKKRFNVLSIKEFCATPNKLFWINPLMQDKNFNSCGQF